MFEIKTCVESTNQENEHQYQFYKLTASRHLYPDHRPDSSTTRRIQTLSTIH